MEFNRVFVPLNNFFSTAILKPLVRNWDWVRSSNHIHRVPRKTIYVGIAPDCLGLLCRSGLAVRTAGEYQQGNQRSSQLRWFIFVQIAY